MPVPRVKICCISSIAEATLAVRYGASALGLVSEMPSGPGVIDESLIAEITKWAPPGVDTFLLTSLQSTGAIIEQYKRCETNTIQLVDRLEPGAHKTLKAALPGVNIVQVVHVTDNSSVEEAISIAPEVDALLLDSGNPNLHVKELGGTGRTHNWNLSHEIVHSSPVPVFLAGGLCAGNVTEAINRVRPYGLDLCSGVRSAGKLDEDKLSAFFKRVNASRA